MVQGIDKLVLVSKTELVIIYTHKDPVTITGPDAWATWLWLNSPTLLRLEVFTRATVTDLEATVAA
jgi:hypothetical protein